VQLQPPHMRAFGESTRVAVECADRDFGVVTCRKTLDSLPARAPNYPGSEPRVEAFCKRFPDAEEHGYIPPGVTGAQPVRLRTGLTPETVCGVAALRCSSTMAPGTTCR